MKIIEYQNVNENYHYGSKVNFSCTRSHEFGKQKMILMFAFRKKTIWFWQVFSTNGSPWFEAGFLQNQKIIFFDFCLGQKPYLWHIVTPCFCEILWCGGPSLKSIWLFMISLTTIWISLGKFLQGVFMSRAPNKINSYISQQNPN